MHLNSKMIRKHLTTGWSFHQGMKRLYCCNKDGQEQSIVHNPFLSKSKYNEMQIEPAEIVTLVCS